MHEGDQRKQHFYEGKPIVPEEEAEESVENHAENLRKLGWKNVTQSKVLARKGLRRQTVMENS